jgi:hypothetical protein
MLDNTNMHSVAGTQPRRDKLPIHALGYPQNVVRYGQK